MKVGFLLFEQFHGKQNIGSSRIRGHWLVKNWKQYAEGLPIEINESEAEVFRMGRKYDVIVYQKTYWIEHAEKFEGIKILDMCDADFLHWGYRVKQMTDLCDAVTTSTEALAEYMRKLTDKPVVCIPDRIALEDFGDMKKDHTGKGIAKVAAWFGYSDNYPMLNTAISSLVRNNFSELIVIADRRNPYQLPPSARDRILLTNMPWTAETVYKDLLGADIILNPKLSSARWKYKSNNKTLTGWALGIPVVHNEPELKAFLTEEARISEGNKRYAEIRDKWDVKRSVIDMKTLISQLNEGRQEITQSDK